MRWTCIDSTVYDTFLWCVFMNERQYKIETGLRHVHSHLVRIQNGMNLHRVRFSILYLWIGGCQSLSTCLLVSWYWTKLLSANCKINKINSHYVTLKDPHVWLFKPLRDVERLQQNSIPFVIHFVRIDLKEDVFLDIRERVAVKRTHVLTELETHPEANAKSSWSLRSPQATKAHTHRKGSHCHIIDGRGITDEAGHSFPSSPIRRSGVNRLSIHYKGANTKLKERKRERKEEKSGEVNCSIFEPAEQLRKERGRSCQKWTTKSCTN